MWKEVWEAVLRASQEDLAWFSKAMGHFRNLIEDLSMEGQW